MAVIWTKAKDEVLELAQELIEEHHPDLSDAAIGIVFRDTAPVSNGKVTLGQASKVPPKMLPYLDLDFLIWLAADFWEDATSVQRRALLDHELCHCSSFEGENTIRPHDIEEFAEIVERYGYWNSGLVVARPAFEAAMQYPLPGLNGDAGQPKTSGLRLVAIDPEWVRG